MIDHTLQIIIPANPYTDPWMKEEVDYCFGYTVPEYDLVPFWFSKGAP